MSSVQFNLLPDIKMANVKAQRTRNMVVTVALIASAAAVALFIILFFSVNVVQKKMLSDADKDITRYTAELKKTPNLSEALTIQSQLKSLSSLHQNKHMTSRIFTYLPQVTPANVKITRLDLTFDANTITIDGTAGSQVDVNTFVDTLKFTDYKVGSADSLAKAFPSVTESSFGITDKNEITYGLTITFDPNLFANNLLDSEGRPQTPILVVPKLTSTHATSNDPANVLFNEKQGGQ